MSLRSNASVREKQTLDNRELYMKYRKLGLCFVVAFASQTFAYEQVILPEGLSFNIAKGESITQLKYLKSPENCVGYDAQGETENIKNKLVIYKWPDRETTCRILELSTATGKVMDYDLVESSTGSSLYAFQIDDEIGLYRQSSIEYPTTNLTLLDYMPASEASHGILHDYNDRWIRFHNDYFTDGWFGFPLGQDKSTFIAPDGTKHRVDGWMTESLPGGAVLLQENLGSMTRLKVYNKNYDSQFVADIPDIPEVDTKIFHHDEKKAEILYTKTPAISHDGMTSLNVELTSTYVVDGVVTGSDTINDTFFIPDSQDLIVEYSPGAEVYFVGAPAKILSKDKAVLYSPSEDGAVPIGGLLHESATAGSSSIAGSNAAIQVYISSRFEPVGARGIVYQNGTVKNVDILERISQVLVDPRDAENFAFELSSAVSTAEIEIERYFTQPMYIKLNDEWMHAYVTFDFLNMEISSVTKTS